jgi:hypothetical protein
MFCKNFNVHKTAWESTNHTNTSTANSGANARRSRSGNKSSQSEYAKLLQKYMTRNPGKPLPKIVPEKYVTKEVFDAIRYSDFYRGDYEMIENIRSPYFDASIYLEYNASRYH